MTQVTAAKVLSQMRAAGHADLHDNVVRFIKALALEVGGTVASGRQPPGLPLVIRGVTWYSLPVPEEPVFFNYSVYPEERQIRVCDLIWVATV
ncbi:hypothetical protein AQJ66_18205 [Streptomyces bungoensis]|uniref:Uncharacterized protein n=1 Tax=Streptomyces bungoensis TaxID=285568 RepID=A0A101T0K2_9ACTN|nr:hypothetical protein AQJ66_18205 [Streptomyces bungoensis]